MASPEAPHGAARPGSTELAKTAGDVSIIAVVVVLAIILIIATSVFFIVRFLSSVVNGGGGPTARPRAPPRGR